MNLQRREDSVHGRFWKGRDKVGRGSAMMSGRARHLIRALIVGIASCLCRTVGEAKAMASGAYRERSLSRRVIDSILAELHGTLFDPVR